MLLCNPFSAFNIYHKGQKKLKHGPHVKISLTAFHDGRFLHAEGEMYHTAYGYNSQVQTLVCSFLFHSSKVALSLLDV